VVRGRAPATVELTFGLVLVHLHSDLTVPACSNKLGGCATIFVLVAFHAATFAPREDVGMIAASIFSWAGSATSRRLFTVRML
jgi:hypothetical protein